MGNSIQFARDLEKESKKLTEDAFRDFRDKLLYDALSIIDESWPVDTGFSRASNLVFQGTPPGGTTSEGEGEGVEHGDPITAEKIDSMEAVLRATDPFETVGIATNVIYAPALEAGHSDQDSHMYQRAMEAIRNVRAG